MTNKRKDEQAQGRTDFGMNTAWCQRLCISLRQWNAIAVIDVFNKKSIPIYDRCSNPVYFNTPLLIIYLSAMETLICHTEIDANRVFA